MLLWPGRLGRDRETRGDAVVVLAITVAALVSVVTRREGHATDDVRHGKPLARKQCSHYFVDLLRASLHFPSFQYLNSPQLFCGATVSAR